MLKRKQLEKIKEEIIKEKKELEEIKKILEDKSEKIDISNTYVFTYGGLSYLVNIENNYPHYVATDIFSKNIIFEFTTYEMINNQKTVVDMEINKYYNEKDRYANITPILELDNNLIKYVDKMVPSYVLQQLLYKLNNLSVHKSNKRKIFGREF